VREAHPTDEWQMDANVKEAVCYPQPHSLKDRLAIANDFTKRFHFELPLVVDPMGNTANNLYSAWPERLYVIEPDRKLSYVGGLGPFNYKPAELRAFLAKRFPASAAH
jgi:iodothyronine deiodinase-like protein